MGTSPVKQPLETPAPNPACKVFSFVNAGSYPLWLLVPFLYPQAQFQGQNQLWHVQKPCSLSTKTYQPWEDSRVCLKFPMFLNPWVPEFRCTMVPTAYDGWYFIHLDILIINYLNLTNVKAPFAHWVPGCLSPQIQSLIPEFLAALVTGFLNLRFPRSLKGNIHPGRDRLHF